MLIFSRNLPESNLPEHRGTPTPEGDTQKLQKKGAAAAAAASILDPQHR